MDAMTAWILGRTPGDFIRPALLERIAGECFRPMNRETARANLACFKRIMDIHQAGFLLFFGTLLGAVRDHDFIEHDYDTDVVIFEEARARLADAAPDLIREGFEFVRCKDRGHFVTFMRNGEFIDVYVAKPSRRFPGRRCWDVDGFLLGADLLPDHTTLEFLGLSFSVPRRYEQALIEMYGFDWRTPRRNCSAPITPDLFHPYRSMVVLVRACLPRRAIRRLKRMIRRA